jgi:hypothetical protein
LPPARSFRGGMSGSGLAAAAEGSGGACEGMGSTGSGMAVGEFRGSLQRGWRLGFPNLFGAWPAVGLFGRRPDLRRRRAASFLLLLRIICCNR